MVVVAASEVIIFSVRRYVGLENHGLVERVDTITVVTKTNLYSGMTIKATDSAWCGTDIPGFCGDIAVGEDGEDGEYGGKIGAHVEATAASFESLSISDVTIPR